MNPKKIARGLLAATAFSCYVSYNLNKTYPDLAVKIQTQLEWSLRQPFVGTTTLSSTQYQPLVNPTTERVRTS